MHFLRGILFLLIAVAFSAPVSAQSLVSFEEIVVSEDAAKDDSLVILQSSMSNAEFRVTNLLPSEKGFENASHRQQYYKALADLSKARADYYKRLVLYVEGTDKVSYRRMIVVHRNAANRRQQRYFASLNEGITDYEF